MNFSVSNSVGLFGGLILLSTLAIAFVIVAAVVTRLVRGRDDEASRPVEPVRDDDLV